MTDIKRHRRRFSSSINFADKSTLFTRVIKLMVTIVIAFSVVGCAPTPTQIVSPTSMASCFPDSVFTTEDMRARVDCHPDDYKLEVNDETVVLFAFPDPMLDWVGPIFIIHISSVSEVVIDTKGRILFDGYKSSVGQHAIENVLNNHELMTRILARAKEIETKR